MTKKNLNLLIKEAVKLSRKLAKLMPKIDRSITDKKTRLGK